MHPWLEVFSSHLASHLPTRESSRKCLQTALVLVQAYCDLYLGDNIHDACQFLSTCSFTSVKKLFELQREVTTMTLDPANKSVKKNSVVELKENLKGVEKTLVEVSKSSCNMTADTRSTESTILVGVLKPDPDSKTGDLIIQDATGTCVVCAAEMNAPDLFSVVMITHATMVTVTKQTVVFCFDSVRKNNIRSYLELHSWVRTRSSEENNSIHVSFNQNEAEQNSSTSYSILDYQELSGVVVCKSPIHKVHRHNAFFFLTLRCCSDNEVAVGDKPKVSGDKAKDADVEKGARQWDGGTEEVSLVVQGSLYMHWFHLIRMYHLVHMTKLRTTTVERGTSGERRILCNSSDSILTVKSVESSSAGGGDGLGLVCGKCVNYMGVITDSTYAEFGLYSLDKQIRLLMSHQPQLQFGRGLRVGAKVIVHNAHPIKQTEGLVLCCCTKSCVEVMDLSTQPTPFHPFIAQIHPISSVCQKMDIRCYLHLVRTLIKMRKNIPSNITITNTDLARLKDLLLGRDSNPCMARPSIFTEFLNLPHQCVFSTKPLVVAKPAILTTVSDLVDYYKEVAQEEPFQCEWLHGREYDRFQHAKRQEGKDMEAARWMYAIVESSCASKNMILCGTIISAANRLMLSDRTASIEIILPGPLDNSLVGRLVVIRSYSVVIERSCFEELLKKKGTTKHNLMFRVYIMATKDDVELVSGFHTDVVEKKRKKPKLDLEDLELTEYGDIPVNSAVEDNVVVTPRGNSVTFILVAREFKRHRSHYDVEIHCEEEQRLFVPGLGKTTLSDLLHRGISLYPFTTSILVCRLHNTSTKKNASINIDSNKFPYLFALLPGVCFTLTNFDILKSNSGSAYYKLNKNSVVEIQSLPPASFNALQVLMNKVEESTRAETVSRQLISLVQEDLRGLSVYRDIFRCRCRVVQVQTIVAKWTCLRCLKDIVQNNCTPSCRRTKKFALEMRCVIDDGTAEAYLNVEEPNSSIFLRLSQLEQDLLKCTSRRNGPIHYQRTLKDNKVLDEDVSNRSRRWQCEQLFISRATSSSMTQLHELYLKPFKRNKPTEGYSSCVLVCGSREFQSVSYRKLNFECVTIRQVDYRSLIKENSTALRDANV